MYTPDRTFVKRLKAEDPKLGCHWNGKHFVVTYDRPYGDPAVIWVVMPDPGQEFRQPDQRDLDAIIASNVERESPDEKHRRVSKYMADFREQIRQRDRDNSRAKGRDNKLQIANAFDRIVGSGKGNSSFRRIDVKPSKHSVIIRPWV